MGEISRSLRVGLALVFVLVSSLVALGSPVGDARADTTTGLTHQWAFDEASGATVTDGVGGADGTLVNATRSSGTVGTGAVTTSQLHDSYVEFPSTVLGVGTSDFTIAFWIRNRADSAPGDPTDIFGNRTEGSDGNYFSLRLTRSEQYTVETSDGAGTGNGVVTGSHGADSAWHHVAVTRSGSTLSFYWDGVLEVS